MANDTQIAVQKRLIYAEDLFEPVDATVLMVSAGGRSGGKTMAMYESLFRTRVELAPTVDAVVLPCKPGEAAFLLMTKNGSLRVVPDVVHMIGCDNDGWFVGFTNTARTRKFSDYGKTVFKSQEEAEAALAKMKEG